MPIEESAAPVSDSSAILVVLFREPGHGMAGARLPGSFMSAVNLSETLQKAMQKGRSAVDVDRLLLLLGVTVINFSGEHAREAARLWPATASKGLSLGDRACIALAIELRRPILTADRAWADLALPVPLQLIER